MDASKIKEHMEVLAADGQHVGTVDHIEGGDKIKLTKNDPASHGHHHLIPVAWVDHVDSHVHLSKNSREVMQGWEHVA
jgi:hypothetical protein